MSANESIGSKEQQLSIPFLVNNLKKICSQKTIRNRKKFKNPLAYFNLESRSLLSLIWGKLSVEHKDVGPNDLQHKSEKLEDPELRMYIENCPLESPQERYIYITEMSIQLSAGMTLYEISIKLSTTGFEGKTGL